MTEEKKESKKRTIDPAVIEILDKAEAEGISTAFERAQTTKPCPIGHEGSCCKICFMGPCRLTGKTTVGVCGATKETVAARNLAREIAAGAAAHSDHGRDMAHTLIAAAEGEAPDYKIKDEKKLRAVARYLEVEAEGKSKEELALEVGRKALAEFGRQEGEILYVKRAPQKRQEIWKKLGITPRGIDREVVETLHRTHMGNDQDAEHILDHAMRTALGDGWGGSMLSTDISDILFGTPGPVAARSNFGGLKEDEVNVVVHGHEPTLSEMIVVASSDPELIEYAKSKGAKGINLMGICCTANEILMRQGIPVVGNFLSQELVIVTGAIEAMVVDIQCIMQGLQEVADHYHTKLITTSPKAHITGAVRMEFNEHKALEIAKQIIRVAIDNFPNRDKKKMLIPDYVDHLIAGFSHEYIAYMQGGIYRESFRPLNDAIMAGRIRGAAGVVGCNNPRVTQDDPHLYIVKELLKNDVLVVTTGCNAIACAKQGLLTAEVMDFAGPGLREVCQTIGIPPVLHMGSCVDNTRILTVLAQCANEGGLGEDISDLPVAGFAPEWMSEKALSIGAYFVASGVTTWMGVGSPVAGSEAVTRIITEGWKEKVGAAYYFEPDHKKAVKEALEHIDAKRAALKLEVYNPTRYAKSDTYLPGDYASDEEFAAGAYSRSK
ncbi:MAG TPA: anaerobic carbon-monoxide dehydrogenase catalytic subunit [Dehalococcoidia bacterium]|nr:anaerobic carbon-monoxide dehydrogenase catalytic subunit [Dehalococcoidia bacterium]